MKTKKLMIALLALGAYFSGNAQTWTPNTLNLTDAISRTGALTINSPTTTNTLTLNNSSISASNFLTGMYVGGTGPSYSLTPTGLTFLRTQYQGPTSSTTISCGLININAAGTNLNTFTCGSTGGTYLSIDGYGNLTSRGIASVGGLTTTAGSVSIYGGLNIGLAGGAALGYGTNYIGFQALRNVAAGTWSVASDGAHNGGGIMYSTVFGDMVFSPVATNTTGTVAQTLTDAQVAANATVRITPNTLYAKEVQVQSSVWADFVFKKDYKLRSLKDVETYINANSHLPEVPSEAEVKEKGINVSAMNALLMQKVEELTLYMIQLQKDNEVMKSEIKAFKK
jgi:hypothetical protein